MTELIDNCTDCREGRAAFKQVIDALVETRTALSEQHIRTLSEWEAQYNAPSNCGHPRCPNRPRREAP